VRIAFIEKSKR